MTAEARRAWETLCHHIDGIAIGTLIETLHSIDGFAPFQTGAVRADDLSACGLTPGDAALSLKLMQGQGIVEPDGDGLSLTSFGCAVAARPEWYEGARNRIRRASDYLSDRSSAADTAQTCKLPQRVAAQQLGPEVAAAWFRMHGQRQDERNPGSEPAVVGHKAARLLQMSGWLETDRKTLTQQGTAAKSFARQYAYPLSYLPTFEAVPELITGRPDNSGALQATDDHLDRGLDIRFSGDVFQSTCRSPFFHAALPLFDGPVGGQPKAIVDTGSGDGTLLVELFKAIHGGTERGRCLARYPLVLIGVEYSELARQTTAERLAQLDTPSLAVLGDVGDPTGIAETLAAHGHDASDALHVNKSVIHNRKHVVPQQSFAAPTTNAVFVSDTGTLIPTDEAYSALVALFQAWRPLIERHGMLSIEAHTVDPAQAARFIGQSLITSLDAAHGFSRQYLAEIGFHRAAALSAGLVSDARFDLGAAMIGEPILSIDHWRIRR